MGKVYVFQSTKSPPLRGYLHWQFTVRNRHSEIRNQGVFIPALTVRNHQSAILHNTPLLFPPVRLPEGALSQGDHFVAGWRKRRGRGMSSLDKVQTPNFHLVPCSGLLARQAVWRGVPNNTLLHQNRLHHPHLRARLHPYKIHSAWRIA